MKSHLHRVQSLTGAVNVYSREVNTHEPRNTCHPAYKVAVKTVQSWWKLKWLWLCFVGFSNCLSNSLTHSIKFGMGGGNCINNNRCKKHHARQYYPVKLSCLHTSNMHRMFKWFYISMFKQGHELWFIHFKPFAASLYFYTWN